MSTILIIEDDANFRFLLAEELAMEGFTVRAARDGREGLDMLRQRPDAVLLDLMMPGIPGEQVLCEIKRLEPQLPVVIYTAYADRRSKVESMGADGFFVKSSDRSELYATLHRLAGAETAAATTG